MDWLLKGLLSILGVDIPKIKGSIGESKAARQLSKLNREGYHVLNDVLIISNEHSSQIDHMVVSLFGIFVVETKHYKGWIHGSERSEYWTQSIYSDKFKFRNPILQNAGHIRALKSIFREYPQLVYYPIIAFTGNAKLKNVYSSVVPVIYGRELHQTIMNLCRTPCLSVGEMAKIVAKIAGMNRSDKATRKNHIQQARRQTYESGQAKRSMICPRCGANLVIRNGKFGNFRGCPNYPQCTYTQNL